LSKIQAKSLKIREKSWKIWEKSENVRKIPEILGKLPENTTKNGAQYSLILIYWRPMWGESHEDFFGGHPNMICVGGNARTKSCPKTFRASLGKFGQKSFAPPKIWLLLHLLP